MIRGEASSSVERPLARVPLVLNKRNFDWITDRIAGVIEGPTPRWWWVSFAITVDGRGDRFVLSRLSDFHRRRHVGIESSGRLGLGHHQFRFLDRYRTRRHSDFRDFVFASAKMAHLDQSLGGSDDALRGYLRGDFPGRARRPRLDGVVPRAVAEQLRHLAELPQPAALGRLRGLDLLLGFGALLVHRIDPGSGDACAIARLRRSRNSSTEFSRSAGAARTATGAITKWRICFLAGLSTPLVLSVHSVVSFDFATSVIPTWHTTIFPPYFVAGAIFGGFAMVLTLLIPARAIFKLQDIITPQHIDKMAKIILLTGSIVSYAYAMEFFVAWYSGNNYEKFAFYNRVFGPYWWYWWVGMLFCNLALAAALLVQAVPLQHLRRLLRLHVRERRHVVRAFHHHRRRIASRFPAVVVGNVLPDLGRYLDLCRHVRNFPVALPAFHSLPADDRDVGSENCFAGS